MSDESNGNSASSSSEIATRLSEALAKTDISEPVERQTDASKPNKSSKGGKSGDYMEQRLKKAEEAGFSRKDAQALLNFSNIMSGRIIKKYLVDWVEETAKEEGLNTVTKNKGGERLKLYKKLLAKLQKINVPDFTGYQELKFDDVNGREHTLRIQGSMVSKDYECELDVPQMGDIPKQEEFVRAVFSNMDRLVDMICQNYVRVVSQSGIVRELGQFFPETDVNMLRVNVNNRSMFLDEERNDRIGILTFYVDSEGRPLERINND